MSMQNNICTFHLRWLQVKEFRLCWQMTKVTFKHWINYKTIKNDTLMYVPNVCALSK